MNWLTPLAQIADAPVAPPTPPKPQRIDVLPPPRKPFTPRVPNRAAFVRMLPGGQQVKRCAGCQEDHDVAAFPKGTGPGDLHRYCRAYQKTWRENRKVLGQAHRKGRRG